MTFSNRSDLGHDSHSFLSLEDRVLKCIDDSEIELTPKQVALKVHANHSTVKNYLRRALRANQLIQPYPGAYCNKITYGVRFVPVLVHNVRLRCFVGVDLASWEVTELVGGVKVCVQFGSERRKVSGFVACDRGMTREACLLALHRWFDVAESRFGGNLGEVELQTFEVNKDYVGVRLDGCQCFTKEGLFGMVERVYQKGEAVRHEVKVSRSMSVTEFEGLLQGGVSGYNVTQQNFMLMQRVDELLEAFKFANSQMVQLSKNQEAMLNWIYRFNGGVKP